MIRIFLTGYMGAGKTTLGGVLVRELHVPFIDLDWHIEEHFHKAVRKLLIEREGSGSKELEKSMLHEVGEFEGMVISTGGRAPCFFDNMEYMNQVDITVFPNVDPEMLFRRLRVTKQQRPILQGKKNGKPFDFIIWILEKRSSFCRQAKYIFCTGKLEDRKQIETSVEQLRKLLGLHIAS